MPAAYQWQSPSGTETDRGWTLGPRESHIGTSFASVQRNPRKRDCKVQGTLTGMQHVLATLCSAEGSEIITAPVVSTYSSAQRKSTCVQAGGTPAVSAAV